MENEVIVVTETQLKLTSAVVSAYHDISAMFEEKCSMDFDSNDEVSSGSHSTCDLESTDVSDSSMDDEDGGGSVGELPLMELGIPAEGECSNEGKTLDDILRGDPSLFAIFEPNDVLKFMAEEKRRSLLEFTLLGLRAVSIGTYLSAPASDILISKFGIVFELANAKNETQLHKICIPISELIDFQIYFGNKAPMIALKTGTRYAAWIRRTLEMDETSHSLFKDISPCFYCPLVGVMQQKWITVHVHGFKKEDVKSIRKMFSGDDPNAAFSFKEIDEWKAKGTLYRMYRGDGL